MSGCAADRPVLGITMGDPGGIGPEIIVAGYREVSEHARPVVIGDAAVIRRAIKVREHPASVRVVDEPNGATGSAETIDVLDLDNVADHAWGQLDAAAGRASLEYVERAIALATAGAIDGIVTGPINKQATRRAGAEHPGHTGLLAERTGTDTYAMLLIEGPLRVAHVSTHVPLREACDLVSTDRVAETIRLTDTGVRRLGVDGPRIGVAGLNPHAGDGGLIGTADDELIAPAVERTGANGIDVAGPLPPDTAFVRAADGEFDAVVAMYHDQGHIPVKLLGFAGGNEVSGVNVTLGLPIVRTSVDHGTAFDIAGQGVASPRSLVQAADVAAQLVAARQGEGG